MHFFSSTTDLEKGNDDSIFNLGLFYYSQKKFDLAEKYLLMAVEHGNKKAIHNLSEFYEKQGKTELARKYEAMDPTGGYRD